MKNGEERHERLCKLMAIELAGFEGGGLSDLKALEEIHEYSIRLYYTIIKLPFLSANVRPKVMSYYRNMTD